MTEFHDGVLSDYERFPYQNKVGGSEVEEVGLEVLLLLVKINKLQNKERSLLHFRKNEESFCKFIFLIYT